jgi:hypothetical protein
MFCSWVEVVLQRGGIVGHTAEQIGTKYQGYLPHRERGKENLQQLETNILALMA